MILLLLVIVASSAFAQLDETVLPFGENFPRVNPEYCVGFRITYPTAYGKAFQFGEITHLAWEVDRKMLDPPDLITRVRILNQYQRNTQVVGENITIFTDGNTGAATFPILTHDTVGLQHYRVMVNYPGKAVHCVFESVPFAVAPRTFERFSVVDTPPPPFSIVNAVSFQGN